MRKQRPLFFSTILAYVLCFFLLPSLGAQPITVPLPPPPGGENIQEPGQGNDGSTEPKKTNFDAAASKLEAEQEQKNEEERKRKELENEKKTKEDDEKDILALQRQVDLPEAKIWGQQFFRDQSISLFTRTRDVKALGAYLLDEGDEIMINVWGRAVYSSNVIVDEEGYIDMSGANVFIPRLYVKRMRFADVRQLIRDRLSKHMDIRGSQFSVELNYSRDITVNITGEVFNPGSYNIPANNTAFNALVASGGPSQIGSVRKIRVVSAEKEPKTLDIYKFVSNPNIADEFFLVNNDYIYVPLAERVVQVQGSVKRPYYYELIESENLLKVLEYAGGLEPDAYKTNIQIKRYIEDEERLIDINLRQVELQNKDYELLNGDIIVVSPIKQAYSNYITVAGAVKLPGEYELEKDMRVRDALMKSGIIYSAVMDRIYIKRLREDLTIEYINSNIFDILTDSSHADNILLRPLDEVEVKFKSEFVDEFTVRVHGAVRRPGEFAYSRNLSLADVLYMSNGIKMEATNSYIELSRLERIDDSTAITFRRFPISEDLEVLGADRVILEPYDQVFVRSSKAFELPRNITIAGEVQFPGIYTLESRRERVWDLLQRCGPTTDIAFLEGATLKRQRDGLVLLNLRELFRDSINSPFNYVLQEGDIIIVPRLRDLVSLTGAIRHPYIRETNEIAQLEFELELEKLATDLERKERLTELQISRKTKPVKVNVPFHQSKRAGYYVRRYGAGLDRQAGGRSRLVYVRYANGEVRRARSFLFFTYYPRVEQGATVFAEAKVKKPKRYRQRETFSLNTLLKEVLTVATSLFTIVLLVRALK